MLLISEQYKWFENSAWYQDASRRAGILACNLNYDIGDFLETATEFVWVEVVAGRVYFSWNDPLDVFDTQILLVKESLSEALMVLNTVREMTFRRGAGGSIINLTIAASCLDSTIGDWYVLAACDHSMPRQGHRLTKNSMYWWNYQLSVLRRRQLTAWRRYTSSKRNNLLHEAVKTAKQL